MAVALCGCYMVCIEKCGIQCGVYGAGRQGVAKAKMLCGDKGNGEIGTGQRGAVYTMWLRRGLGFCGYSAVYTKRMKGTRRAVGEMVVYRDVVRCMQDVEALGRAGGDAVRCIQSGR